MFANLLNGLWRLLTTLPIVCAFFFIVGMMVRFPTIVIPLVFVVAIIMICIEDVKYDDDDL